MTQTQEALHPEGELRDALAELLRVIESLDKNGNAAGIWLLIHAAMKKARAVLAKSEAAPNEVLGDGP